MDDSKTATERLRELLDEEGVEWADRFGPFPVTAYEANGVVWVAKEYTVGMFSVETRPVTPEQAIAATLGSEREANLQAALNKAAGNWAKAQIEAEDYAKENMILKAKLEAATLGSELNPDGLPVCMTISEDGNLLNWCGENYVRQSTLGSGTLTAEQVREAVEKHWHDLSDEYDMPEASALPEYSYDWQAIADELNAELVSGECEFKWSLADNGWADHTCSYCGYVKNTDVHVELGYNYCPNCGRAVKR